MEVPLSGMRDRQYKGMEVGDGVWYTRNREKASLTSLLSTGRGVISSETEKMNCAQVL